MNICHKNGCKEIIAYQKKKDQTRYLTNKSRYYSSFYAERNKSKMKNGNVQTLKEKTESNVLIN